MAKRKESININDFCETCGFFNAYTRINNGYGCDHPEQEEWEHTKIVGEDEDDYIADETKVKHALLRKIYGSYQDIKAAIESDGELVRERLNHAMYEDKEALKAIGVKKQGCCFAWSCPIAVQYEDEEDTDYVVPLEL